MASLIDLRRRIRSVKNTQQITKAMKMVAAAKLRRAQDKILSTRPYALELRRVTGYLAAGGGSGEALHPLLQERDEKRALVAVVTGDKGLCGSFNANVIRRSDQLLRSLKEEHDAVDLLCLGRRGSDYYRRRSHTMRAEHRSLFSNVSYDDASTIGQDAIGAFLNDEYDAVYVVYNQFVSVIQQKLTVEKILPISAEAGDDEAGAGEADGVDWIFEPSVSAILDELLPRFVTFQFYRVLLESQAAEHGARMTAMDAATKNASELIDKLTLTYNRRRQAAITTELIEVVSGAAAMAG